MNTEAILQELLKKIDALTETIDDTEIEVMRATTQDSATNRTSICRNTRPAVQRSETREGDYGLHWSTI